MHTIFLEHIETAYFSAARTSRISKYFAHKLVYDVHDRSHLVKQPNQNVIDIKSGSLRLSAQDSSFAPTVSPEAVNQAAPIFILLGSNILFSATLM